ncbi:MAG: hypothetical protein PWQ37_611 [Candidatus Petromonas sp.]|jgi:4-azaleucine resistance transporter AzlC|nr:hypothetical protein [Candidatus Petromonas sp.]
MREKYFDIKEGLVTGFPIVIGYVPIAMAFGILAKATGITMMDSFLFSALVYAGASQFMALNLLNAGVGIGEIIVATLLMNFRHFLMSASLSTKMRNREKKWIPLIAFGVTDETFSVASFKKQMIDKEFILPLQAVAYFSWIGGTFLGYIVGEILPSDIKSSMGIALYAMFVAILIPEAKKSSRVALLAGLSGMMNFLLNYFKVLPQGWTLVLVIIIVAAFGAFVFDREEVKTIE